MSEFTKYLECGEPLLDFCDILKAITREDSEGNIGLNLLVIPRTDCTATSAIECGQMESCEELLNRAIVEDECGNPALAVYINTASICAECD